VTVKWRSSTFLPIEHCSRRSGKEIHRGKESSGLSGHVKRGEGWGSPDEARFGANPIPIPHPNNLELFGHKLITLSIQSGQGAEPPLLPHFNHWKKGKDGQGKLGSEGRGGEGNESGPANTSKVKVRRPKSSLMRPPQCK